MKLTAKYQITSDTITLFLPSEFAATLLDDDLLARLFDDSTRDFADIGGSTKPDDNADVTAVSTAYDTTYVAGVAAATVKTNAQTGAELTEDNATVIHPSSVDGVDLSDGNVIDLSQLSNNLGDILAGTITGVIVTGGIVQTALTGRRVIITSEGITLHVTALTGKYANFKYGDGTHRGTGALAYIHHASQSVPFYISAEQAVADFHYYNRSSDPTGAAEIGDTCVVSGELKICTVAGTPGTWVLVGDQAA